MTLSINKLNTHCRFPKGSERFRGVAEDAARGPLASELRAQLGPSLDRLPPVVRLNELRVKVKIPARNLNAFTLANEWARAFTLALHQSLARPPGDGATYSRRYESEIAYKAALLCHIIRNGVCSSWEFPELARWLGHSASGALVGILLSDRKNIAGAIAELQHAGLVERLLALCDESALEDVMLALGPESETAAPMTLEALIEIGSAACIVGGVFGRWTLSSRRQAIRLWARTGCRVPLQSLWHGLRLLQKLLEIPSLLTSFDCTLLVDSTPFPSWCDRLVIQAAHTSRETKRPKQLSSPHAELLAVLEALRPLVPSAANSASVHSSASWIVSDSAGILLLLSIARRLDLWRFAHTPEFIKFGGPRALSFLLAGIGMNLLGPWNRMASVEPAVATFAGILEQPDIQGMQQFFSSANVDAVRDLVRAKTWAETLDAAASVMAHTFAALVRGFRTASRESIVRQFIRVPGRILIEESRVLVVLAPNPWAVALRLSGMDDRLPRIEWLDYRSVEFVLEGL